jgi:4-hydroxybenzoate polyprenyltransferase
MLLVCGFALGIFASILAAVFIFAYALLNFAYSMYLKRKPVFDVFCIAAGFIFRIYAGGTPLYGLVSDWLFLTVVAMSLFMAFGKRRGELTSTENKTTREVLQKYDLNFLNGMVYMCAGLAVVFYALWAMMRENYMVFTVPIVIFIIARYLLVLQNSEAHGDPTTIIYSDKTILIAGAVYAVLTVVLLYTAI